MNRLRARPARGTQTERLISTDRDALATVLEDAAHFPGGTAAGVAAPVSEIDITCVLRESRAVLPIGAQSSLTGGATPRGETVVRTDRLNRILEVGRAHVRVEAGVPVVELQKTLADRGLAYPPVPTFHGAFVGGVVATNAAGAATFKYGTTREWVEALTVVLADGSVLDIDRGAVRADEGRLAVALQDGRQIQIVVPSYTPPAVPKRSAGYLAAHDLDAIDLFIGSEGTLGIITEVTLRVLSPAPALCLVLIPCESEAGALELVAELRDRTRATWRSRDPRGPDVAAIEQMDRRCIQLLRDEGAESRFGVPLPDWADTLLLVHLELPSGTSAAGMYAEIGAALDPRSSGPLTEICRMLDARDLLDHTQIAAPGETARAEQLFALREAVPAAVNRRVGLAQAKVDSRITKTAADMIVPFEHFAAMMARYRERLELRGLDYAIWGHSSDGNVHPNVIPRSYEDVESGREAILELGRDAAAFGGCPLAEHGVGRNAVKQALLRQLYGDDGIEQMRAVKRALDPDWKLAPGVLFPRE